MKRMGITVPQIIIMILIAALLLAFAWREENWIMPVRLILAGAAILILAVAIAGIIAWMQYNAAVVEEQRQRAYSYSERVRLVMELAHLNPEQLAAMGKFQQVVQISGGDADVTPIPAWPLMGGGWTTKAFIERLIGLGDAVNLPAIRDLAESDRDQAKEVYADFIQRGWVSPARGNQPARWLDRQAAINQIFGGSNA